ncbi:hypothetical protein ACQ5TV_05790 [Acetobacter ghanensis]|uniref:hypothetical protein n=1 Tax=Acetobacter ghanensis TaxID=431306 RepID=UPI003D3438F7
MTDQKPTGVFVRLPLSGDAVSILRQHISSKSVTNDELINAIRAIGTPVQGGAPPILAKRYDCPEKTRVHAIEDGPLPFADEVETNLCDANAAQAQIAARDAQLAIKDVQIARMQTALEDIRQELASNAGPPRMHCLRAFVAKALRG